MNSGSGWISSAPDARGRSACERLPIAAAPGEGCDVREAARLEAKTGGIRILSMSGAQSLDTSTATGRLMLAVIGAVGQAEREAMLERQREGIAKAKREGRCKGRVPTARRQVSGIIRLKKAGGPPPVRSAGGRETRQTANF